MLQKQIQNDMVNAMKAKETEKLNFLRYIVGQINLIGKDVSDEVILKLLKSTKKGCNENIEKKGTSVKDELEIEIIETYLPTNLTEDHIRVIVEGVIEARGFSGMNDMGKVMGALKSHPNASQIDGKISSKIVKETLMK